MSDCEDYNSEEDADYVPSENELLSEEENSGEEEDFSLLAEDGDAANASRSKAKKTGKKKAAILLRKRKGGIKLNEQDAEGNEDQPSNVRNEELVAQIKQEAEEVKEEKERKRADDLWASFMSDVKPPLKKPSTSSSLTISPGSVAGAKANGVKTSANKVTVTKVFDFAGEEVRVTKEVDASSKEAQAEIKAQLKEEQATAANAATSMSGSTLPVLKRPAQSGSGLGSVLSKIGKKQKMGTLEKSKLDWESFKSKEGITEDLKNHNKGRDGYIERMAFLNRTDVRQFEIERDLRQSNRGKR